MARPGLDMGSITLEQIEAHMEDAADDVDIAANNILGMAIQHVQNGVNPINNVPILLDEHQ